MQAHFLYDTRPLGGCHFFQDACSIVFEPAESGVGELQACLRVECRCRRLCSGLVVLCHFSINGRLYD